MAQSLAALPHDEKCNPLNVSPSQHREDDHTVNRAVVLSLHRPCPACGGRSTPLGRKGTFTMLRCSHCGCLHTAEVPSSAGRPDYDQTYTATEMADVPEFIHQRVSDIVSSFHRYRQTNRFLDLGFGSAVFLQAAAAQGWDVSGVEVSRSAVENARRLGFPNVFHGDLATADYPARRFDVVVASEVLEHVEDVRTLLQGVIRVLRPGGLFWASTPHARGLSFRLLRLQWSVVCPPQHLQLFSVPALKLLLRDAGFQSISLTTHGFNPYEVLQTHFGSGHGTGTGPGVKAGTTSRELNERWMRTPSRRAGKQVLNAMLNLTRLGDRLKVHAIR
jgi:SAM-dependent methyltransferase